MLKLSCFIAVLFGLLSAYAVAEESNVRVARIQLDRGRCLLDRSSTSQSCHGRDLTSLLLSIVTKRTILSLSKDTKLLTFTDDKGTDLLSRISQPSIVSELFVNKSDGKGSATIMISSSQLPHPEASKLSVSGILVFRTSDSTETLQSTEFQLAEGRTITINDFSFVVESRPDQTLEQFGSAFFGMAGAKNPTDSTLTFRLTAGDFSQIANAAVLLENGKRIEAQRTTHAETIEGLQTSKQWLSIVKPKPSKAATKARIELEIRREADIETIPFSLTTGLGL